MTTSTSELTITLDLPEITFPTAKKRRHDTIWIVLIAGGIIGALIAGIILTAVFAHHPDSSAPIAAALGVAGLLMFGVWSQDS